MQDRFFSKFSISSEKSGSLYEVTMTIADGKLEISCDCPAGILGKICRHKTDLCEGNVSELVNELDENRLLLFIEAFNLSQGAIVMKSMQEKESQLEKLKAQIKNEKSQLGRMMAQGIKVALL